MKAINCKRQAGRQAQIKHSIQKQSWTLSIQTKVVQVHGPKSTLITLLFGLLDGMAGHTQPHAARQDWQISISPSHLSISQPQTWLTP
jgi:hypothetical protein